MRKIVHVDMDAFYASVEQRDDPRLRGQPVVVAWRGARSVVCAASYEARRFGIRSAMPALRAERLCPDAVFVPPDFTRYRAASKAVREILLQHTDLVEPLSLDEAFLDVSENKLGLPSATAVASQIRDQIRSELKLTASAGIAPNKFLAKIASDWRKPDGQFVIRPEQVDAFLAPLPVERISGVGKVTAGRLNALGIHTVGELRGWEAEVLEEEFGRYGRRLYELARGIDLRPVTPDQPTQSVSAEDTFEQDLPLAELEPPIDVPATTFGCTPISSSPMITPICDQPRDEPLPSAKPTTGPAGFGFCGDPAAGGSTAAGLVSAAGATGRLDDAMKEVSKNVERGLGACARRMRSRAYRKFTDRSAAPASIL